MVVVQWMCVWDVGLLDGWVLGYGVIGCMMEVDRSEVL